jgi:hypothetical protein
MCFATGDSQSTDSAADSGCIEDKTSPVSKSRFKKLLNKLRVSRDKPVQMPSGSNVRVHGPRGTPAEA